MAVTAMLNKIYNGEIAAVHNYGAFVRLPGMGRTQGLVHKSQISSSRVDDATEVLAINEKVWFKVISVSEDGKVGLSMKVVDQGSGRDLDPNGVQLSLDVQQRKERLVHGESKAITLDAIYKTNCSRCGVLGHLAKNCFQTKESKSYDLIPEPVPEKKIFGSVGSIQDRLKRLAGEVIPAEQTKELKKEDEKRHKKKKRKRESDSDSSSHAKKRKKEKKHRKKSDSDSSDSEPKKNKKDKKRKKHKKHKRRS